MDIQIQVLLGLITTFFFYRINLLQIKKINIFEKFKTYLKRDGKIGPKNGIYEQDTWLEKDILYQMMALYEDSNYTDRAILDYLTDFKVYERAKIWLIIGIIFTMLLIFIDSMPVYLGQIYKYYSEIVNIIWIIICVIYSMRDPDNCLFNNRFLEPSNSEIIRKRFISTERKVLKEILDLKRKFLIKNKK